MEFIADIKGGVIVPAHDISRFLARCEGKKARIILGWVLKKRTLKQNSYYKGVVVPRFGEFLRSSGSKVTNEQADLLLKHWCDFTRDTEMPDGTVVKLPRSTTECDTKAMSELTEKAVAEIAVRFNHYIPMPEDQRWGDYATA